MSASDYGLAINMISSNTGLVLRTLREQNGASLKDTEAVCGISTSVISRVERAEAVASLNVLVILSVHLGARLSAVMRIAENDALPWLPNVWTDTPSRYLGCSVAEDPDSLGLAWAGPAGKRTYRVTVPGEIQSVSYCVGLLLRRARVRQGMTAADLSDRCGIGLNSITRHELVRDMLRLPLLTVLSIHLGVRLSYILQLAEDHSFPSKAWADIPERFLELSLVYRSAERESA